MRILPNNAVVGIGFSYAPYVEVDAPDHIAADLIKHGLATEVVPPQDPETATVKAKGETRKK